MVVEASRYSGFPLFVSPSHCMLQQWLLWLRTFRNLFFKQVLVRITAAGTAPVFHRIPLHRWAGMPSDCQFRGTKLMIFIYVVTFFFKFIYFSHKQRDTHLIFYILYRMTEKRSAEKNFLRKNQKALIRISGKNEAESDKKIKNKGSFLYCFRFPLSLCLNWFRMNVSVIRIKRESGANPGQSRCCEALLKS